MAGRKAHSDANDNRSLIILLIALLLFIFMDKQAKRQIDIKMGNLIDIAPQNEIQRQNIGNNPRVKENLIPLIELVKENNIDINDLKEPIEDAIDPLSEPIVQGTNQALQGKIREIQVNDSMVVTKYPQISWQDIMDSLKPAIPNITNKIHAEQDSIVNDKGFYELYFIKYAKGKNSLIATKRWTNKNPLPLLDVLLELRKGPRPDEKSLLNNFTPNISIYEAKIKNGSAKLDLGKGMDRYSKHVIEDRIDQIVYTLTQFAEINNVSIKIEGKREYFLGKIPLEGYLHRRERQVYQYTPD